jgi:hypothetical protein
MGEVRERDGSLLLNEEIHTSPQERSQNKTCARVKKERTKTKRQNVSRLWVRERKSENDK